MLYDAFYIIWTAIIYFRCFLILSVLKFFMNGLGTICTRWSARSVYTIPIPWSSSAEPLLLLLYDQYNHLLSREIGKGRHTSQIYPLVHTYHAKGLRNNALSVLSRCECGSPKAVRRTSDDAVKSCPCGWAQIYSERLLKTQALERFTLLTKENAERFYLGY